MALYKLCTEYHTYYYENDNSLSHSLPLLFSPGDCYMYICFSLVIQVSTVTHGILIHNEMSFLKHYTFDYSQSPQWNI